MKKKKRWAAPFSTSGQPKVHLREDATNLTSNAGGLPVGQFLNAIGFHASARQITGKAVAKNTLFSFATVLYMSIIAVCLGAKNLTQITCVWGDRVLCRILGIIRVPHQTTIARVLDKFSDASVYQMEELCHLLRERAWKRALHQGVSRVAECNEFWVDLDSTPTPAYGVQQEGVAKNYKGIRSYHPLIAFCVETKEIIQAWFRSGNTHTANGATEFIKELLAHFAVDGRRIILRGDSGFFVSSLIELLETKGHGYLLKVRLGRDLHPTLAKQIWREVPGEVGWEQTEFVRMCRGWSRPRRHVALRQVNKKKTDKARLQGQGDLFNMVEYDYLCFLYSEEATPWETRILYNQRGTCETWIEEAKNQMGMGHFKTGRFLSNALLFQMTVLAYNTLRWMALFSKEPEIQKMEPATIRTFLIRVAGKLLTGGRKLVLRLAVSGLYQKERREWFQLGFA